MKLYNQNMSFKRCVATEVVAAGISAAGSIIGAGATAVGQANLNKKNRKFAEEQSEKQREWSEKMYHEQNAWNYEMWNAENEYNSPAAQKQRLLDAGLNPLYYGLDGTGNANDLEAAQPLGYDQASLVGQVNPYAGFGDIATKVAQVANIQADTALKNNENLTETQRREKLQAEIVVTEQELKNKLADEKLTDTQRMRIEKDLEWCDRLNDAVLAEKQAAAALSQSQKKRIEELLEGEKVIQSKTIEDFEYKWQKIGAEIKKMSKETGLLEKDIENYALNHANNGFMGTGLSLQNLIRAAVGRTNVTERDMPEDVEQLIREGQ